MHTHLRQSVVVDSFDDHVAACVINTPIGPIHLIARGGTLTGIRFGMPTEGCDEMTGGDRAACEPLRVQLIEYFAGARCTFDFGIPADVGTPFQRRVWSELLRIPFGKTISYAELARRVGNPAASRAVGAANGRNPFPIVVPCHRVIGADGRLVGFGGGLDVKRRLLQFEQAAAGVGESPNSAYLIPDMHR